MKKQNTPHGRRIPALFLAFACGLAAATASAALTDPVQIQTEAYINLVQADQSLDAERLDEALAQYQVARDYYLQLAKDFPGHEPRVIQYRKTYCDNQIADIERRKAGGQPEELPELEPLPSEALPEAASDADAHAAPESTATAGRSVEVDYLKNRIASLEAEVAEIDALQGEIDILAAQNDKLRRDLEFANGQLAERTGGEQAALEALRTELAAKDGQIQSLQQELDSKNQLDQALNDMEAQNNELRAQNDRLDKEIKTLDAELDDAEVRADQAELKAKQAEAKAKDADKKIAALSSKPSAEKAGPADPAKAVQPAPETAKPVATASPVKATVPPKPIPDGMVASDYVRQLLQEGDNDSALATVQAARKAFPTDMNLVLIEGIALIRLQRYPEAATMLVDLAKNHPKDAEIHATLGAAMMGAGFYEEARRELLMAIRLDKNVGGEYYYNLAQLFALVEPIDLKQARKHYQQARNLGIAADKALEKALK